MGFISSCETDGRPAGCFASAEAPYSEISPVVRWCGVGDEGHGGKQQGRETEVRPSPKDTNAPVFSLGRSQFGDSHLIPSKTTQIPTFGRPGWSPRGNFYNWGVCSSCGKVAFRSQPRPKIRRAMLHRGGCPFDHFGACNQKIQPFSGGFFGVPQPESFAGNLIRRGNSTLILWTSGRRETSGPASSVTRMRPTGPSVLAAQTLILASHRRKFRGGVQNGPLKWLASFWLPREYRPKGKSVMRNAHFVWSAPDGG